MRFLKREWFQITFLLILFLSLLYTPLTVRILQTPPDRFYTGAEKFYQDYYSILAIMNLGSKGTLYPVHIEYQLLGKISSVIKLPNYISYHLVRIIVSALIFLALYKLAFTLKLNKPSRLLMMISGLFLSAPPIFLNISRPPDMFNLYTQSMHHELGILLTILLLIFYMRKKYKYLLITAFILGIVHSVSAILIAISVFVYALIFHRSLPARLNTLVFGVALLSPLVIYKIIFTLDSSLSEIGTNIESNFANYNLVKTSPSLIFSYLFYLSPFILFSLPLILARHLITSRELLDLREKTLKYCKIPMLSQNQKNAFFLAFFYILANIFMYLIGFYLLKIERGRFGITSLPIAFSILITLSSCLFSNRKKIYLISLAVLIFSLPTWYISLKKDVTAFGNISRLNEFVYPDKKYMEAIFFLKTLPPGKTLALDYSGNFLTSFGEKESFLNSRFFTTNHYDKYLNSTAFFEGRMPEAFASKYLAKEKIRYVFLGLYEKRSYFDISSFKFLTKVYSNPSATIFKFYPIPGLRIDN